MSRIVVGIDQSECSVHAVRWALAEAAQRGCPLTVVHVWEHHYVYDGSGHDWALASDQFAEMWAQRLLDAKLAEACAGSAAPPGVEARLAEGKPSAVLIELSRDADLLVVGARGHGGFHRLRMGSVASQVVRHAVCPVTVVPVRQPSTV